MLRINPNHLFAIRLLAVILYAFLIAYVSLVDDSKGSSAPVPDLNSFSVRHLDKIMHFLCYALFSILLVPLCKRKRSQLFALMWIITYGLLLEMAQSFVPMREASLDDFFANFLGALLGVLLLLISSRYYKKKLLKRSTAYTLR